MTAPEDATASRVRTLLPGLVSVDLSAGNAYGLAAGRYWSISTRDDPEEWAGVEGAPGIAARTEGEFLIEAPGGGLLRDLAYDRRGLTDGEVVTVVVPFLRWLPDLPPPAPGRTRIDASCLALGEDGRPLVVPGLSFESEVPSAVARVGRLMYQAIAGQRWENAALPIPHVAADATREFRELALSLFDEDRPLAVWEDDAEAAPLAAHVAVTAPPQPLGLRPTSSTADPDDAPTGSLPRGSVLAALLEQVDPGSARGSAGTPDTADRADAGPGKGRQGRGRPGTRESLLPRPSRRAWFGRGLFPGHRGKGRRKTSGGRRLDSVGRTATGTAGGAPLDRAHEASLRRPRHRRRWPRLVISIAIACAAAMLLGLLFLPKAPAPQGDGEAATTGSSSTSSSPGGAPPETVTVADDPREALADLSRFRTDFLSSGRSDRLPELTVPDSPASRAEARLASTFPPGSTGKDLIMTVEDIRVVEGDCEARAPGGSRCTLAATSVTTEFTQRVGDESRRRPEARDRLRFTLLRTKTGWRVESVA